MRPAVKYLIFFLAFLALPSFKVPGMTPGGEWVYEREKKGIKVFTKKSKWGRLRDCKAMMTVSGKPEEVLKVLTDFDHYYTWFPRCKKSSIVARLGENESI